MPKEPTINFNISRRVLLLILFICIPYGFMTSMLILFLNSVQLGDSNIASLIASIFATCVLVLLATTGNRLTTINLHNNHRILNVDRILNWKLLVYFGIPIAILYIGMFAYLTVRLIFVDQVHWVVILMFGIMDVICIPLLIIAIKDIRLRFVVYKRYYLEPPTILDAYTERCPKCGLSMTFIKTENTVDHYACSHCHATYEKTITQTSQ